jgi:hypothetical protein
MANRILRHETAEAREARQKADEEAVWWADCPRCDRIKGTLADLRGHRCPDGTPTRLNEASDGPAD